MSAASELVNAHQSRGMRAADDLHHATLAPALFKPEFVEQRRADLDRAIRSARYWTTIGGGR